MTEPSVEQELISAALVVVVLGLATVFVFLTLTALWRSGLRRWTGNGWLFPPEPSLKAVSSSLAEAGLVPSPRCYPGHRPLSSPVEAVSCCWGASCAVLVLALHSAPADVSGERSVVPFNL